MHTATLIACSAVVALVCVANCANSWPASRFSDDPVLSVVIDGKKVEIPRYQPKEVKLSNERYAFEQNAVTSVKDMMTKLARKALINGRGSVRLFFSVEKVLSKLENIDDSNDQLMRTDPYTLASGFGESNGQMLDRMIKRVVGENLEVLTKEKAFKRFELIMEAVERLNAMSNTGLNLDWTKLKVDGKSLEQYLKPSMLMLVERNGLHNILKTAARYMKGTKNAGKKNQPPVKVDVGDFEDEYDMA